MTSLESFSHENVLTYYRVFRKMLEMLKNRGFIISDRVFEMQYPTFMSFFGANFEKGSSLFPEKCNFIATHSGIC